ncbi:MAG: hemolysin family protein [Ignavibacterium sp.]|nr:hemolysin family protein [Ignavibacterium sp.]
MILLITVVILLIINFLLSVSEIALGAFGENKISELEENNDPDADIFKKFLQNQDAVYGSLNFLYTINLVIISILGYLIINDYLFNFFKQYEGLQSVAVILSLLITSLSLTFVVLILNVLIPKSIAFKYSDYIGRKSVRKILFISNIFSPFSSLATFLANLFLRPMKEKIAFSETKPFEDEILDIISDGVKSGTVDQTEQEIIENIFETTDLTVEQVMIPRTEMVALDVLDDYKENIQKIIQTGHTLIPVYEKNIDNIIGILHTKDLMKASISGEKIDFKELMRPAYFVPENKPIFQTLKEMQKQGQRVAIVTDEYGGTEGMITIEDILEEIIGEIKSEREEFSEYNKGSDGKYYVLGTMNISDFNEVFNYKLPESDDYNTVAGFVASKSGMILNPGDKFEFDDLVFELIKKIRQKMVQFRIYSKKSDFAEVKDK